MANWVNISTIDNNTPFYNVAWKVGVGSGDRWFAEASGLTTDNKSWNGGTGEANGYYTFHRFNSNQYTCTFTSRGRINYGAKIEYGVSVEDEPRSNLPTQTINGDTCYVLGITNWEDWKPLYAPYSSMTKYNGFTIYVDLDNPSTPTLTGITIENLSINNDVPASGGTVSSADCTFNVIAAYSDSSTGDVTTSATVSGSLTVTASTATTRHQAGTLALTATYNSQSATSSVTVYQEAATPISWLTISPVSGNGNATITVSASSYTELVDRVAYIVASNTQYSLSASATVTQTAYVPPPTVTGITFGSLTWAVDVPSSGGTADKDNCVYTIYANYSDNTHVDVTSSATVSGSLNVSATTATTRENVGTLTLAASYSGFTTSSGVTAYQASSNPYQSEYLTFNIISGGTLVWTKKNTSYSIDNGLTWIQITTTGGTQIGVNSGDRVLFKGNHSRCQFGAVSGSTALFELEGNIMSIIYGDDFTTSSTLNYENTFLAMFRGCTGLTSAENLVLPTTTLTGGCYQNMFENCTSLTTAPALHATSLSVQCYYAMFQGCTSLTTAPALLATTLKSNCYANMFQGCTSLTTAPELPATTLSNGCYDSMFANCTALVTAPSILPATTLPGSVCYRSMFQGCTSLTTAPVLSATTLIGSLCCENMFQGCTSLTTAPALLATTVSEGCYKNMFQGCTALVATPSILPAETVESGCYQNMFANCTALVTAPELPAETLEVGCYAGMFSGCSSLNYIKCLRNDNVTTSSPTFLTNWVDGVAETGTFVKNKYMNNWKTGISGIPSGWTVVDAT